ncbi:MAG TPA: hypothetical protein VMU75_06100 [Acidimicrobiales bacterium]|nr:hypothetical protein [Acidimicrobiales bacterium]
MSDHIHIEKGAAPWKPSEAASLTEVFHEFTIPLVGAIEQDSVSYLFWCVVGHAGPENAWAYAHVSSIELDTLRDAPGEAFDQVLRNLASARVCSFAIASDDKGIVEWVDLEPPADFDTAHERGMSALSQKVTEAMEEMQHLLEQFPSIQAATGFSISPSPRMVSVD